MFVKEADDVCLLEKNIKLTTLVCSLQTVGEANTVVLRSTWPIFFSTDSINAAVTLKLKKKTLKLSSK